MGWVIVGSNSLLQITVVGTPGGKMFGTEDAAEMTRKRLDNRPTDVQYLVVEVKGS